MDSLPLNLSMKEIVETDDKSEGDGNLDKNPSEGDGEMKNGEETTDKLTSDTANLKIAWQYGKYLDKDTNPLTNIQGRSSSSIAAANVNGSKIRAKTNYCCSYDISSRIQPFLLKRNPPFILIKDGKSYTQLIREMELFIQISLWLVWNLKPKFRNYKRT